jgi:hypothetical protein
MLDGQPIGPKRQRALVFYGRLVGGAYIVLGILGLLMTGLTPFAPSTGETMVIFAVNPFTNVLHLALGLIVVPAVERPGLVQRVALAVGALTVIWAVLGFALDGSTADVFATSVETAVLHLVTGLVGLGLAIGVPRRAPAAGTA